MSSSISSSRSTSGGGLVCRDAVDNRSDLRGVVLTAPSSRSGSRSPVGSGRSSRRLCLRGDDRGVLLLSCKLYISDQFRYIIGYVIARVEQTTS